MPGGPGRARAPAAPDWQARFRERAAAARNPALKAFYEAGTVAADTPLSRVPFVALDLETTGLDAERNSIVSVGLVPFDLERIRLAGSRHWLVRPRRAFRDVSIPIHGITHSDLENAPDLADILDELLEALAGRVAVVHFRGIERPFLDRGLRVRLDEGLEFPVVDTMELEARVHRRRRGPVGRLIDRLAGRRPPSIRLAACRERFHLPRYGAHNALTDALATAELFQAQVAHRFSPETPIRELWH